MMVIVVSNELGEKVNAFSIGESVTVLNPLYHVPNGSGCNVAEYGTHVSGTVTDIVGDWYRVKFDSPIAHPCGCAHANAWNVYTANELQGQTFCEV